MKDKRRSIGFMRSLILILVSVSFLVACGGGGGGSAPAPVPATQSANGIWNGTIVDNINGTFEVACLLYEGEIIAISDDAGRIYMGTYTVSGNTFSASVDAYDIGGGLADSGTMSGTVAEQDSLTASFQSPSTNGTISVTFDQTYNRPSSFSLAEGNWLEVNGAYSRSLTIDAAGGITGSDSDGCIATGVASILDPSHNLYGVDVDLTQCGVLNGSYDGFAGLFDDSSTNDNLTAVLTNDSYIIFYSLTRQ